MSDKTFRRKSKFLSLVLRHRPELISITLDEGGWIEIETLIEKAAQKGTILSLDELKKLVKACTKQRFAFNEDQTKIRANQGHSVKVNLGYQAKTPPDILYHGTAEKYIQSIMNQGIRKRKRHHVHLSGGENTARTVGSRHGKPIILKVMAKEMYAQGIKFYQSENGVWLTDFVEVKYIFI